jgi:flagellar L-ring protein FlgH
MKRLLASLLVLGCASSKPPPYQARHREYKPQPESAQSSAPGTPGSLWRDGRSTSNLFTDARALRENDLVVIRVEEIADASRVSNTDLARSTQQNMQIAAFLNRVATTTKNLGAQAGLSASSTGGFSGDGRSSRTEHLTATVPSIVRSVLPNGNLFVEGHRMVLVNEEEQHFYISGVVRPIDIEQDNSLKSSVVADAEIEFTGQGDLSENQKQGWLARHLGWLWPF